MSYLLKNDVREPLNKYLSTYLKKDSVVYDIGCGAKPYQKHVESLGGEYVGVDIEDGFYDADHIDLIGSAYDVPAKDNSIDAVISGQVIEHLCEPEKALQETNRILKQDGLFFISFPFLYPMHAIPRDYFRYTEYCLDQLSEKHGFKILEKTSIGGFWYCAGIFLGLYLKAFNQGIVKKLKIGDIIIWILKALCLGLHKLEGFGLKKIMKKDPEEFRQMWAMNYVYVLQKI